LTPQILAQSRRFRQDAGLRSDDLWIRQVAADPASAPGTLKYGVPLTPEEVRELESRNRSVQSIKEPVIDYGDSHPRDWAGAWIDQRNGGLLIAQFTERVNEHRAALADLVGPAAPLEVRAADFTLADLQEIASSVRGDDPWFATIPAVLYGWGTSVPVNRVKLEISSVNPNAASMIEDHFGWKGVVEVESDGTGALLLPRGQLEIVTTNPAGLPVPGLRCIAVADMPGAWETPMDIPHTDRRGFCALDLPATGYWIRLDQGEDQSIVGIGRAVVSANAKTRVAISVTAP